MAIVRTNEERPNSSASAPYSLKDLLRLIADSSKRSNKSGSFDVSGVFTSKIHWGTIMLNGSLYQQEM
jgi:hypothetical protein